MNEGPTTPEKKRHRPTPGKNWDGGSLGRRRPATDNPQSPRELMAPGAGLEPATDALTGRCSTIELARKRVIDTAWEAISDQLSPPLAKGIPPISPLREGSVSTVNRSVIGQPITGPHAQRRPHHLSQLPAAPHNRSLKRCIGHQTFRRPIIS